MNDKNYISQNKQKKIDLTAELSAKVQKAKGIVLTNYTGLTHQQLEGLKRAVKKLDAEFIVAKNTLLKRSLGEIKLNEAVFDQPTAALFAYADIIEPLKVIAKSIKEINLPILKAGWLDGSALSDKEVEKLATLPAKPILQAQLLGMMQQPISGLHRTLNWNLQSFVMTLNAIAQKKQL